MVSSHLAGDVRDAAAKQTRRSIWSGTLAGVGLVAFIDETVFHQSLHWHHFYDKSTLAVGLVGRLVSRGRVHRDGRRSFPAGRCAPPGRLRPETVVGRLAAGVGGFQLYDGIVQHKLLGLHQIRYHVTIWTLSPMAGKLAVALREAWLAQAGMSRAAVLTRVPVPPPAPGDTRNGSLRARLNPEHLIVAGQGQKPQHLRLRARPAPYRRRRAGPVRAPAARRQASCNR